MNGSEKSNIQTAILIVVSTETQALGSRSLAWFARVASYRVQLSTDIGAGLGTHGSSLGNPFCFGSPPRVTAAIATCQMTMSEPALIVTHVCPVPLFTFEYSRTSLSETADGHFSVLQTENMTPVFDRVPMGAPYSHTNPTLTPQMNSLFYFGR